LVVFWSPQEEVARALAKRAKKRKGARIMGNLSFNYIQVPGAFEDCLTGETVTVLSRA
jgi:hypothetical protein